MKNLCIIFSILLSINTFAQDEELPGEINKAFKAKYPNAQNIIWDMADDVYEIEFEVSSFSFTAYYTSSAEWKETAKIISDMEVPAAAMNAINKKYPDSEIVFAEFVETNKNEKFYRLNSFNEDGDYIINVTADGKIISAKEQVSVENSEED